MHEDRAALVHLASSISDLRTELAELDRLILDVVAPRVQGIHAALNLLQDEIRDLAGIERIDVAGGLQIAEEASPPAPGEPEGGGAETAA